MAGTYRPLAALLLATVVTLLVATSTVRVAAAADKYSGRMVIIRAPSRTSVIDVSAGGVALNNNRQQQQRRRLVEDEVAPEFGGLLGAGNGGGVANKALNPDKAVCLPDAGCGAKSRGGSNTRPCTYKDHCSQGPPST